VAYCLVQDLDVRQVAMIDLVYRMTEHVSSAKKRGASDSRQLSSPMPLWGAGYLLYRSRPVPQPLNERKEA